MAAISPFSSSSFSSVFSSACLSGFFVSDLEVVPDKYPVNAFIFPVNIKTPINIINIPPILTVYFTTFIWFLKNSKTVVVNRPTTKNGIINPTVYTPIRANPAHFVVADAAIKSTLASAAHTASTQN